MLILTTLILLRIYYEYFTLSKVINLEFNVIVRFISFFNHFANGMSLSPEEKRRFLKALDEDEEFRLAVVGLLGITDVKSSLDKLIEVTSRLVTITEGIVNGLGDLTKDVKELKEINQRYEEELKALREENNKIWLEIKALREGQEKLWQEVKALRENQEKLWEAVKHLQEGQNKLWKENNKIWKEIRRMRRDIDTIKMTLDNLTSSIEEEANDVVMHLLKDKGIELKTDRITLNSRFEFDVYGTNGQVTIIGEAKTKIGPRLIAKIDERVNKAINMFPGKFPGRVVKLVYCLRAMPGAIEEAERRGIWLIESMKERTRLPLGS